MIPVLSRWHAGGGLPVCESASDPAAVISSITDALFCFIGNICQQHIGAHEITDLFRSQMQANRPTLAITYGMQL
ncbi:hypothetical protein BAR24_11015 [Gluconobacter oxydans]|nr:hypothetical protein B932_3030 [Gluconobacter oxydans H24]ANQ41939.1 hypothetical protein BAR24_11015 [Gluconobacter oxydans]